MKTIKISQDFSEAPGARYYEDGPFSGEEFRETLLKTAFEENDQILIDLDGTEGYATSFLEESFGGLAREFGINEVLAKIKFISQEDPALIEEITDYINEALNN